ncbi:MAG: class I SAM-dependent rRNA methyltransferase [Elusimicrobia bacterium]|nr:class I SAM-dependent rRNA methyltransferase [Elusimicrobiota bacterium]
MLKKDAAAPPGHSGPLPWAKLRSAPAGPQAFKRMLDSVDPQAKAGDLVSVYDKNGSPYGVGFYNPRSLISLRILGRETGASDADAFFAARLDQAHRLRVDFGIEAASEAYRLAHDYGDGLPGLVIDRYGDVFVLEFYSLGMFRQAERLERLLRARFPGCRVVRRASEYTEKMEGFQVKPGPELRVRVRENGVAFEVTPSGGYKTGFFCDQRDNRLALSKHASGKRVLDVCAYTGGFGLYAKKLGGAEEVTSVELDPEASEAAKKNANINQVRLRAVTADAFPFLRQMAFNEERWDVVVLDPYKLISSRERYAEGRQKYIDLNRLGLSVVREGGLFLTFSCSGIVPMEEFQQFVRAAAGSAGRRVQIFRKSGAGADHPFAVDYPEGEYLKALWCRVF